MPTAIMPHPQPTSSKPLHHDVFATPDLHKLLDSNSNSNSSHTSSPSLQPIDVRSPILEEEDETASETASEAATEPLTPTSQEHFHNGDHATAIIDDQHHSYQTIQGYHPLAVNTTLKPEKETFLPPVEAKSPRTPLQKRPTYSSKDSGLRRAVSGLFRRSNTAQTLEPLRLADPKMANNNGSDPVLGQEHRRTSVRQLSATASPCTTESNTPSSPELPVHTDLNGGRQAEQSKNQAQEPDVPDSIARKQQRSSTGFSLKGKLHKHKITFGVHEKMPNRQERASSVDLNAAQSESATCCDVEEMPRRDWGIAADWGAGVKARRISLSVSDIFYVDVGELYKEYSDQSKIMGRRGKNLGNGATASVGLMKKKGGSSGETYAVKEFRGKSSKEEAADYENKVKSEFSIAKSAHHPNIVETFRLCTHNGRWNHVMEFCETGDLFNLVNQKYLHNEKHTVDRLCLFKQLIQGLHYLHEHGIAHRDIKLENLLITKDSKLKITDFGVSEVFSGTHPGLLAAEGQCGKGMEAVRLCSPGICGSSPYIAPEVLEKKGDYDPRPLDVWGAAIVMICMSAGGYLWHEARVGKSPVYDDLIRGWEKWNSKHSDAPDATITDTDYPHVRFCDQKISPPALRRMLLTMLNPDPKKRASMTSIANNRWFKTVECCQKDSYEDPTKKIDAAKSGCCSSKVPKIVQHNHLPPVTHIGHKLVRLPGST